MFRRKRKDPWNELMNNEISFTEYLRRKDREVSNTIVLGNIALMVAAVIIVVLCNILL